MVSILFTDIVGSTELAVRLGDREWQRLLARHHTAVRSELRRFGGHEVDTAGDGFLATFDRPAEGIRAAAAIVAEVGKLGISVRTGLHAGEAEVVDGKIGGIAVHIASRVMSAAEPGEVLVSGTVRELVAGSGLAFASRGQHALKGVPEAWYLWALAASDGSEAPAAAGPTSSAESRQPSLPLPDRPSIAVLPFTNMSGDAAQDYFADGMVEDIITGLARVKWIFVIARNSSLAYRDRAMDVKEVGKELGVRYVLEGSVRKSPDRLRITAQLIDAETGAHVWADRYDRAIDDIFAVQDELTTSVVGVIEPTLRKAEIERARRKRPESLDAYDLYLRALPLVFTAMPRDADEALTILGRAVELEPEYAVAHAMIAWCHEQRYLRGGGRREEAKVLALRHSRQALALGSDDASALAIAGFVVAVVDSDFSTASAAFDRALALSDSSALALGFSSIVRAWQGNEATAVDHAQRAIRLSPFDPLLYVPYIGLAYAYFAESRFEEAADAAARAAQSNPRFTMPHVLQAAALARLDRPTQAALAIERLLELEPTITISSAVRSARFVDAKRIAALADALRSLGLPE